MQACTCYCPGHFSTQIHTQVTLQIKKRKHCWIISQHDPFSISQGIGLKAEQGTASEENWPSEAVSQCRCGWCNLKLGLRSKRPTVEKKSYHQVYDAWLAPIMHHIWWTSEAGFHFCCRWFGQFGIMFGIAGQLQQSFKTILKQADLELIDLWILATTQLLVLLHFIFWFHRT